MSSPWQSPSHQSQISPRLIALTARPLIFKNFTVPGSKVSLANIGDAFVLSISTLSIIILDDMERPGESDTYAAHLDSKSAMWGRDNWLIIVSGTKSEVGFLDSVGICDAFSVTCRLPTLKTDDAKKVLEQLNVFAEEDVSAAAEALNDMLLKKLHMLVAMAAQGEQGIAEEAIYSEREKIKISHISDCLQDVLAFCSSLQSGVCRFLM